MMNDLSDRLDAVEKLAKASKLYKFFTRPLKYIFAVAFNTLLYPVIRKGILVRTNTFFGLPMHVLLPAGTDIFIAGGKTHDSEIRLARFILKKLKEKDVFVDIGAHFGYFSLLASTIARQGAVYAFEASGNNFEILKKNTRNIDTIRLIHKAVADREGTIEFYELPVIFSEYNTLEVEQFEQESWYRNIAPRKRSVESVRLDTFVREIGTAPAMVKIDVEGAEHKVIEGARNYLTENAPIVIMEYVEKRRNNLNHQKAVRFLNEMNYRAFSIDQSGDLTECNDIDSLLTEENLESDNIVFIKNF